MVCILCAGNVKRVRRGNLFYDFANIARNNDEGIELVILGFTILIFNDCLAKV